MTRVEAYLIILTMFVCAAFGIVTWEYSKLQQTRVATCALYHDYQNRVKSTKQFLAINHERPTVLGFTQAQLRSTLKQQEATLKALGKAHC